MGSRDIFGEHVAANRPAVGWRLWNVGKDPVVLISPSAHGVLRIAALLALSSPPMMVVSYAERTQRAACSICGDPPAPATVHGHSGCGLHAMADPEGLHELVAHFRHDLSKVNDGLARIGRPLWDPGDLAQFAAVSRVVGWGRVIQSPVRTPGRQSAPAWRAEWMCLTGIWLGEPLAAAADGLHASLHARYDVPVTVVATEAGLSPLASIVAAVAGPPPDGGTGGGPAKGRPST